MNCLFMSFGLAYLVSGIFLSMLYNFFVYQSYVNDLLTFDKGFRMITSFLLCQTGNNEQNLSFANCSRSVLTYSSYNYWAPTPGQALCAVILRMDKAQFLPSRISWFSIHKYQSKLFISSFGCQYTCPPAMLVPFCFYFTTVFYQLSSRWMSEGNSASRDHKVLGLIPAVCHGCFLDHFLVLMKNITSGVKSIARALTFM